MRTRTKSNVVNKRFLKAKALVDKGATIKAACQKVGITIPSYQNRIKTKHKVKWPYPNTQHLRPSIYIGLLSIGTELCAIATDLENRRVRRESGRRI